MESGAHRRSDIATMTGLPADVVDAAIEHLLRTGRLRAQTLATGCPTGGCSGCGEPTGTGCQTAATRSPGPVLVTLVARPESPTDLAPR